MEPQRVPVVASLPAFVAVLVAALVAVLAVFVSCIPIQQAGNPETGFFIRGYVGDGPSTPAIGVAVELLDAATGQVSATAQTSWSGAYTFGGLKPGKYVVQVASIKKRVVISSSDLRLDLDLTAPDGTMDYMRVAAAPAKETSPPSGAPRSPAAPAAAPGANDGALQTWIAGHYWMFSGTSGYGGGGGSEQSLTLCASGRFQRASESGYYGPGWGTAGRGGSAGIWSISGDRGQGRIQLNYDGGSSETVQYRDVGDNCFTFNGTKLCYAKAAVCE